MFRFYRKVDKSEENEYGIELVEDENPFEKPIFLSLLALNQQIRDTNGSISRALEFAGIRLPSGEDSMPLKDIPVDFLGLSYGELVGIKFKKMASGDSLASASRGTEEFVKKYMFPLISADGKKRSVDECRKNMRNINIMCFCDALIMVSSMNKTLVNEMSRLGFSEEEIDDILSQVCIIPVGTEYSTIKSVVSDLKFTTLFVLDIKDSFGISNEESLKKLFGEFRERCFKIKDAFSVSGDGVNKNSRLLIANDDGNHSLSSFIHKGKTFPSIIVKTVSGILNNSISNNNSDMFIPLDSIVGDALDQVCETLIGMRREETKEDLLSDTLSRVTYPSKEEISIKKN